MEISVVITTYNLEAHIERCLEELFSQTMQSFDIIIADDCSKDGTLKIVEQWKERYPERIRVLPLEKNTGMAACVRNIVLDSGLVDGKYTIFLDGDDSLEPNYLQRLYERAEETGADIVFCAYDRVELETGRVLCTEMMNFAELIELPPNSDILAFINSALWNKMLRTERIGEIRGPAIKIGEDLCFLLEMYEHSRLIAGVPEQLIRYQISEGSVIATAQLDSIVGLAERLRVLHDEAEGVYRDTLALVAFIHVGISMCIRAHNNPKIPTAEHVRRTRQYFCEHFDMFKGCKFLSLRSLSKHGFKGIALWICKLLYKARCFILFLWAYKLVTTVFKIDFKF